MPDFITVEKRNEVGLVVFDRPAVLNAWNRAMRREIIAACEALERDPGIRAVVFTGAGERAFAAGQDLREGGPAESEVDQWIEEWRAHFHARGAVLKTQRLGVLGE